MDYNEFLQSKRFISQSTGFTPDNINPMLFDFQRDIDRWACKKGKAGIFAQCGLGKTPMQLAWGEQVCKYGDVLIAAPLAVSRQTVREGQKFNIPVNLCRTQTDVKAGINITNYEMLEHFDAGKFAGIILDECFPPNTLIDVVEGEKIKRRAISDIKINDHIINAWGIDNVTETHKRRINRAVQISINGRTITSSENHPFFTMYGWRSAKDLQPGDYLMATETAMRLVREGIFPKIYSPEIPKILREILLSEMENEPEIDTGKGSLSGDSGKTRAKKERMVQEWLSGSFERNRAHSDVEPYEARGNTKEGFCDVTGDEPQTFRAWGKWEDNERARISGECSSRKLDSGICYITGETKTGIPDMLQSRLGESRLENSNRSRWELSPFKEEVRQEERQYAGFIRVESVEVLELGDSRLDEFRDKNGDIYFYDIKAKRHPSFSIDGILVHNSSILKSYDGKYRNTIISMFRDTPYKLSCTATPAPNDFMELGNQCEFLNVMSRTEMLATFFVHDGGDTSKWRLKGHAEDKFWEWVASWAVVIQRPSDLGYSDGKFILPPLNIQEIIVDSPRKSQHGQLSFVPELALTLQERREARRDSLENRVAAAAELTKNGEQWVLWCDLNAESDALTKAIPGAVEVKGSDSQEHKESAAIGFANGDIRVLVSKPSIFGFGLNWQSCHNMAFVGLSDSYEQIYQAMRRCWRFGQICPVNVYIITSRREGAVKANIERKEADSERMINEMVRYTKDILSKEIRGTVRETTDYNPTEEMILPEWLGVVA